jgi:hypothetical protein
MNQENSIQAEIHNEEMGNKLQETKNSETLRCGATTRRQASRAAETTVGDIARSEAPAPHPS